MNRIIKVYPTHEELSSVCSQVRCPEKSCSAVFQSGSNLNMHLIKHHKIDLSGLTKKEMIYEYHCPTETCVYHKDSKKHFSKLKYLKQHYLKIHATKSFTCDKCDKRFSTLSFRNCHERNCGKLYICACGVNYNSSEAILTHCKRKGKDHFTVKTDGPKKELFPAIDTKNKLCDVNLSTLGRKVERLICPKLPNESFPIHYIAAIALSELSAPCDLSKVTDKGVQTDLIQNHQINESKLGQMHKFERKRKNSQQTQTLPGKCKKIKISAETQTNSDYLKLKQKSSLKTQLKKRKKSMETQTKYIARLPVENNSVQLDDVKAKSSKVLDDVLQKKFLNTDNLVQDIFYDSSSTSSVDSKNPKSIGNLNSKSSEIAKVYQSSDEQAKKWAWDSQSTPINQAPLVANVNNEFFSINNELNICSRELDANFNDLSVPYSKRNPQLYNMGQSTISQFFDINKLCNIETQTEIEIDTFLTECSDDASFNLCSTTETQTTNDFDPLLYSNMCTQTCEEVDQLFNFNFVDIETQTAWPDLNDCNDLNS